MEALMTTTTSEDSASAEIERLQKNIVELKARLSHAVMFDNELQLQQYIDAPPVPNKEYLFQQACANDGVTCDSWIDTWLDHAAKNAANFDVKSLGVESEYGKLAYKPCIIAGSGPSLRKNAAQLKDRGEIGLVSCLHNFGYLEDLGCPADYYVNLDAGDITIPEMTQGGTKDAEHYLELTRDRTLVTSITGNPELLKRWRGKILFFMVVAPHPKWNDKFMEDIGLPCIFSVGGNTLGACLYMAKAVLGANPIALVGADFSFGYNKKFHSWDSPYDKQYSGLMWATDIFGNRVGTWPSYSNFKSWFEYIACGGKGNQPCTMVNCTEGGILGAYPQGNIRQIQQLTLKEFLFTYNLHKMFPDALTGVKGYRLLF